MDTNMNDKYSLRICIIGAGIGGITTALALARAGFQNIDLYERSATGGFVGAGIQLLPNMVRVLDQLEASSDKEIGNIDVRYFETAFGSPWMVGHRSSIVDAVQKACNQFPAVRFHFSHKAEITSFTPHPSIQITPNDAAIMPYLLSVDIVLGADGVKSFTRTSLLNALGTTAPLIDTTEAAYRIMLHRSQLTPHPDLLALLDADTATRWIDTNKHIIGYPISSKQILNIATFQPDTNFASAPLSIYTNKGSKAAMMAVFANFCPKLRKLLDLVPEGEVCEWKLRVHAPLPTWVHHAVALLGDACHAMLPHIAQGASQAVEDAAVIAVVLSKMPDAAPESINKALRVYEKVRKGRAEMLVKLAAASGRILMEEEREAIKKRNEQLAAMGKGGPVPDNFLDRGVQDMIFGTDCVKIAEEIFDSAYTAMQ